LSEQSANDAHTLSASRRPDNPFGEQVEQNVIVVASVERDVTGASGFGNGAHYVECLVAVERGNLDGDYVRDLDEAPPEFERQQPATDGRLEVKTDQRNLLCDRSAMCDQFTLGASRSAPNDSSPAW
jgi:hypothetical protein